MFDWQLQFFQIIHRLLKHSKLNLLDKLHYHRAVKKTTFEPQLLIHVQCTLFYLAKANENTRRTVLIYI